MSNVKVNAQTYPVTRKFTVDVGQSVLIVAGQCVGVYTGEEGIPIAPATPRPHKEELHTGKPTRRNVKLRSTYIRQDGRPVATVEPYIEQIRKAIRAKSQLTVREIGEITGVRRGEAGYWRIRDALTYLSHTGEIVGHGNTTNRWFTLANKKESAA